MEGWVGGEHRVLRGPCGPGTAAPERTCERKPYRAGFSNCRLQGRSSQLFVNKVFIFYFIFIFYWCIVDLQYHVSFRRTAKWISYIHISMYFFQIFSIIGYYKILRGLPWWRSGWESACRCRGHGLEPWSGRIPHAAERLGPWATTTEPACLEPVLRNKRGHDSERPAHCDEELPPLATTGESPRTETKTQHSQT